MRLHAPYQLTGSACLSLLQQRAALHTTWLTVALHAALHSPGWLQRCAGQSGRGACAGAKRKWLAEHAAVFRPEGLCRMQPSPAIQCGDIGARQAMGVMKGMAMTARHALKPRAAVATCA